MTATRWICWRRSCSVSKLRFGFQWFKDENKPKLSYFLNTECREHCTLHCTLSRALVSWEIMMYDILIYYKLKAKIHNSHELIKVREYYMVLPWGGQHCNNEVNKSVCSIIRKVLIRAIIIWAIVKILYSLNANFVWHGIESPK